MLFNNTCQGCAKGEIKFVPTPDLEHYGKEVCAVCGTYKKWRPFPSPEDAHERHVKLKIVRGTCVYCQRGAMH